MIFRKLSKLSPNEKKYWVPVLFGVGTSIALLGISTINSVGVSAWAGWIDIIFGIVFMVWGMIWSKYVSTSETLALAPKVSAEKAIGEKPIEHKGFRHEVLPDKGEPYFLGDNVGLSVKITNLLDQPQVGRFFFLIYLPDGMYLPRPLYPVDFKPREEKTIQLGDPVFCAFLGIFRLVIVVGDAEDDLIKTGATSRPITFQTIFAGYSRDREDYRLQNEMISLTSWIRNLTVILVILTIILIAASLFVIQKQ